MPSRLKPASRLTTSLSEKVGRRLLAYTAPPGPLLVAFSGGPDSVALVLVLVELGYRMRLAYVNHGLRGAESEQEEARVRAFAQAQDLPVEVLRLALDDFQGPQSLQATARRLRYAWMERLLEECQIPWGVTAHTQDDWAETLVYQLVRGGNIWMVGGIPYRRGRWLRPLLQVSRAELIAFLYEKGVRAYLLDSSNYEPKYLRNIIRWRVLPALRQVHPRVERRLRARYQLYHLQRMRLEKLYQNLAQRYVELEPFGGLLRTGLQKDAFFWILQKEAALSWRQAQPVYRLYRRGRRGAFRQVGEKVFCRVPRGLQWGPVVWWKPTWPPLTIAGAGTFEWGLWRFKVQAEPGSGANLLALPEALFPVRVRLWQPGDRIAPTGLHGHTRKLSDIWPEVGLYGFRRQHAFVIEDREGLLRYAVYYRPHWQLPTLNGPFLYLNWTYGDRT